MSEILALDFMRYALLAALMAGVSAPLVGTFLVQRRLSLIGDGLGHVALAGVAIGLLLDSQPVLTALVAAAVAAVGIEVIRARGRTGGDVALAIIFYGGIAAGVVIINRVDGGQSANLTAYLFGAITTTTPADLAVFAVLSGAIVAITLVLRQRLFAAAGDEEFARASGLPVVALNVLLSVLTAVTVVVSMRVVGLLLISALMIVPNAAAGRLAHSFRGITVLAVLLGVVSAVGGVITSYYADTATGGTIVLLAIALFGVAAAAGPLVHAQHRRRRPRHTGGPTTPTTPTTQEATR